MADTYKTVVRPAGPSVFKDRGSKFLGYIFPVENEAQIKENLAKIKKEHHSARHWCYAYRLGKTNPAERANDDGEPAHSAGVPILNQIKKADLTDTLVIVVRYFGGVKLGVGGLIRAYKTAAEEVIREAEITEKEIREEVTVRFPYAVMNEVMRLVKKFQIPVLSRNGDTEMEMTIALKPGEKEKILDELKQLKGIKIK